MGRRILSTSFAIVWVALLADHALGAGQVDIDKTHVLDADATGIHRFHDESAVLQTQEELIDIELAEARSKTGDVKLLVRTNLLPFVDPNHPEGGVLVEMMRKAFEYAGYELAFDFSGWEADESHFRRVNILYPYDQSKEAEYLFSAPVMNVNVRVYRHRNSKFNVGSVADLAGRRVCAGQAFLAQTIDMLGSSGAIDPIEDDLIRCFQGLLNGEHDIVLAEWEIGEFYVNQLAIKAWLTASDDVLDLGDLYAVIPRVSPYSTVMMHDLNEALRKMRQSGELEALLKADEKRRSVVVHDNPIAMPDLILPQKAESPGASDSGVPKGATM